MCGCKRSGIEYPKSDRIGDLPKVGPFNGLTASDFSDLEARIIRSRLQDKLDGEWLRGTYTVSAEPPEGYYYDITKDKDFVRMEAIIQQVEAAARESEQQRKLRELAQFVGMLATVSPRNLLSYLPHELVYYIETQALPIEQQSVPLQLGWNGKFMDTLIVDDMDSVPDEGAEGPLGEFHAFPLPHPQPTGSRATAPVLSGLRTTQVFFINLYKAGYWHRQGKPGVTNVHGGDLYTTEEDARRDADHSKGFIGTYPVEVEAWVADFNPQFRRNADDSTPVPLNISRPQFKENWVPHVDSPT